MRHRLVVGVASLLVVAAGAVTAWADVNCEKSGYPFTRDECAVSQCPNGQWSRGSVQVLNDGRVLASAGLETDRLDYGASGWIEFRLKDAYGNTLAYGNTQKRSIPAKSPGRARIEKFPAVESRIPAEIARKVRKVEVSAICTDGPFTPFGIQISGEDAAKALRVVLGSP